MESLKHKKHCITISQSGSFLYADISDPQGMPWDFVQRAKVGSIDFPDDDAVAARAAFKTAKMWVRTFGRENA